MLPEGSARCVQSFDDSLVLQFAWRIAFHCVLHRYGSQDIHCWKCFFVMFWPQRDTKLYEKACARIHCLVYKSKSHNILNWNVIESLKMGAEAPQVYTVSRDAKERARGCFFEETTSNSPFVIFPILCSARRKSPHGANNGRNGGVVMILPQVHLRKPCYDFTFL